MDYQPMRGSMADKVIDWLRRQPAGSMHLDSVIADRFSTPRSGLFGYLKPGIKHGAVKMENREGRVYFGLGDGVQPQKPNGLVWPAPAPVEQPLPPDDRGAELGQAEAIQSAAVTEQGTELQEQPAEEAAPVPAPAEIPVWVAEAKREDRWVEGGPLRCALWNDGTLVIEQAGIRLELDQADTKVLCTYLDRVLAVDGLGT